MKIIKQLHRQWLGMFLLTLVSVSILSGCSGSSENPLTASNTNNLLTAGEEFTCVIQSGAVKCWGDNRSAQLGLELPGFNDRGVSAGQMGDSLASLDVGSSRTISAISGGENHSCAVLDDGSVVCWGDNRYGQLGKGDTSPTGGESGEMGTNLTSVNLGTGKTATDVAVGDNHSCALLNDGTVKCWGINSSGQLGQGDRINRGDTSGQLGDILLPISLGTGRSATAITAGRNHTCALLDDSTVKCWGQGFFGQLGQGSTNIGDETGEMGDNLLAVDRGTDPLAAAISATAITAGNNHTCALLSDASVKCWGDNFNGQLGQDDQFVVGTSPGQVSALSSIVLGANALAISAGGAHTCALLSDASVKCWGNNYYGQLGQGAVDNRGDASGEMTALTAIDLGTNVLLGAPHTAKAITTGSNHSCAILDDDSVKCWGDGQFGQLGQGSVAALGDSAGEMAALTAIDLGTNVLLSAPYTAKAITTGSNHSCATLDDNTTKCWGSNLYAQLGLGDGKRVGDEAADMGVSVTSVNLGTGRTAKSVVAGTAYACALLDNDTVKCWGDNNSGQLGQGHLNRLGDSIGELGDNLIALDFGVGRSVQAVTAGKSHACALLDDFTVKCWGANNSGQLGQGDTNARGGNVNELGDSLNAIDVGTGRKIRQISAGGAHSCAILDDNTVKCWGDNTYGQLGYGDINNRGDASGEMGDSLYPVSLGDNRFAIDIAAANDYTCALLDDNTVKCWGRNQFGQLGQGNLDNLGDAGSEMGNNLNPVLLGAGRSAKTIVATGATTCALLDNDTVKCWGNNTNGGLGLGDVSHRGDAGGEMGDNLLPVDLGNGNTALSITTSGRHSCAKLNNGSIKCWGANNVSQLGLGDGEDRGNNLGEMGDALPIVDLF